MFDFQTCLTKSAGSLTSDLCPSKDLNCSKEEVGQLTKLSKKVKISRSQERCIIAVSVQWVPEEDVINLLCHPGTAAAWYLPNGVCQPSVI